MSAPWGKEGISNNADKSGQGEGGGSAVKVRLSSSPCVKIENEEANKKWV